MLVHKQQKKMVLVKSVKDRGLIIVITVYIMHSIQYVYKLHNETQDAQLV